MLRTSLADCLDNITKTSLSRTAYSFNQTAQKYAKNCILQMVPSWE